jgi:hypothetical protein
MLLQGLQCMQIHSCTVGVLLQDLLGGCLAAARPAEAGSKEGPEWYKIKAARSTTAGVVDTSLRKMPS